MAANSLSPRLIAPLVCSLCLSVAGLPARAANDCPWMSETTASSLLGGDAVGAYTTAAGSSPAVCTFTRTAPGATRTLRLSMEVASASPHDRLAAMERACGAQAETLHAIGNEAVACSSKGQGAGATEIAFGRVRDQLFTITLTTDLKNDRELNKDALKARIYTAAEQFAGNLF